MSFVRNKFKLCQLSIIGSDCVSSFLWPKKLLLKLSRLSSHKECLFQPKMDEHGMIHPDNVPAGMRIPTADKIPPDLYIDETMNLKDIGKKYRPYFGTTKYVLIDLSGTLHIGNKETPGASVALKKLRDSGVKIRFVTNTTKESKRLLFNRLCDIGFVVDKDEIFSSLVAARKKIEQLKIRPYFLIEDEAKEDFEGIDTVDPSGVVVGLSPTNFDYTGLNKAFRLLFHGCPLIAIHKGKYYRKEEGMLALGPGPFILALEFATGSNSILVGKPSLEFFRAAIDEQGISPSDIIMIGDDVEDDVIGAMNAGYNGVLVKTGKYLNGDELKCCPKFPTVVADNFSQAVDIIVASMSVENSASLKVDELPSSDKLSQIEKEKQRHIAAYTKDCEQKCYRAPLPTTEKS